MGVAASQVSLSAAGEATAIEGTVRVAASQAVAAFLLPPVVEQIREEFSNLEVEVVVSNQVADLRKREADIAIRHTQPKDPELFGTRVREASGAWMYATPGYIKKLGSPQSIEAFCDSGATIFGFDERPLMRDMLTAQGYRLKRNTFAIRSEDHLVQWEMAKRGLGVCIMMEEVGEAEPRVEKLLGHLGPPASFPTWLVTHKELKTSLRIRTVFDRIVAEFR